MKLILLLIILSGGIQVCRSAQFEAPQPIKQTPPIYPKSMMDRGVTGTVIYMFKVGTDGSVERVDIIESPHRDLSKEVSRVVKTWRFVPGKKDGKITALAMRGRISFECVYREDGTRDAQIEINGKKTEGEPGATDNPDDAQ